jgi:sugar phosphate isomerase/epimerase
MLKMSVFTVMLPDLTPEQAATTLKQSGYEGVEWRVTQVPEERRSEEPSFWGNNLCTFEPDVTQAARARRVAEAEDLSIVSLGTYIDVGDLEATENAMRFAQACGAPQVRVGSGHWPNGESYATGFERAKRFLGSVQDLARQYGVKGLIEIHHRTLTPSAGLAHRLVDGFDPDLIGVIHDVGNMVHEGFENYRMGIELLGPYLAHVHIKNARWRRPASGGVWISEWAPLEDGVVNWDDLFAALRDMGYSGWLGLEDFSRTRPSRETLDYDITFLRNVIERIYG